ncbi:MAG: hypothetical protein AAGC55_20780, partial [Myxococcota bacterium]
MSASPAQPEVGSLFAGRYEIREKLAPAPAWTRYRAVDGDVDVEVELWRFRPELWPDAAARDRLVRAVHNARRTDHPHLLRLFTTGQSGDAVYATTSLSELHPPPTAPAALIDYAAATAQALAAVHAAGRVHGRLTPGDIVLSEGRLRVRAAGLYRDLDHQAARPFFRDYGRYLAPEVRSGDRATRAADIYSLAAIMASFAAGPDTADLQTALERLAAEKRPLHKILTTALAVGPHQRPSSTTELITSAAAALDLDGRLPTAAEPPASAATLAATEVTVLGSAPLPPGGSPAATQGPSNRAGAARPGRRAGAGPGQGADSPVHSDTVDDGSTEQVVRFDRGDLAGDGDESTTVT